LSVSAFTDRNQKPDDIEVSSIMGGTRFLWDELVAHIRITYKSVEDFKFLYGKNYGWGYRFRVKGKLLTALYPIDGGFTVQIILSPEAVETARSISKSQNVRKAIDEANRTPKAAGYSSAWRTRLILRLFTGCWN
jgi:hypothetical protein